jgi:hypothetical protein
MSPINKNRAIFTLDPEVVNATLVHELQHAVDANDPELLSQDSHARERLIKKTFKRARVARFGEAALVVGGCMLAAKGIVDRNTTEITEGITLFTIANIARVTKMFHPLVLYHGREYNELPGEKRAISSVDNARMNGGIPKIIYFKQQ